MFNGFSQRALAVGLTRNLLSSGLLLNFSTTHNPVKIGSTTPTKSRKDTVQRLE